MLPTSYRLSKEQIRLVFSSGRRTVLPPFLCFITNSTGTRPRFALVVSKRVVKLASKRNRTRRLLRNGLVTQIPKLPSPINMIVVVQRQPQELNQKSINALLEKLFIHIRHPDGHRSPMTIKVDPKKIPDQVRDDMNKTK